MMKSLCDKNEIYDHVIIFLFYMGCCLSSQSKKIKRKDEQEVV
jgi:hypothetical protein